MSWGGNDRGPTLIGVTWALTALATVACVLRAISRTAFDRNRLGLDDYITFFALAWNYAEGIAISLAVEVGFGKHLTDIEPQNLALVAYRSLIVNSIVVWAFSIPKFAIIALLNRLLRLNKRTYITFWAVALINQGGILATSVLWWYRCTPVQANWDPTVPGAKCNSFEALTVLGYITSIISAILDMFFALYPVYFVMKLKLSLQKRVAISLSLGLGAIASAISIYKVTTFPEVVPLLTTDPTYAGVPIVLFADVEANILIITACLPITGPVLRWALGKTPYRTTQKSGGDPTSRNAVGAAGNKYGFSAHSHKKYSPLDESIGTTSDAHNQDDIALGRYGGPKFDQNAEGQPGPLNSNFAIHKSVQISLSSERV